MDAEEEVDQAQGIGSRLIEFMFGNVDSKGEVDAGYLDEGARESLFALTGDLGPYLADLGLEDSPWARSKELNGNAEQVECPFLPADFSNSAFVFSSYLPSTQSGLFDEEDYDAVEKNMEENEIELHDSRRSSVNLLDPLDSSGKSCELKAGIDLPVLCMEDGKEVLRFSEIFGARDPSLDVRRMFPAGKSGVDKRLRNSKLSNTVENDDPDFLKMCLHVPVMTREFSREIEDHAKTVGGNGDSCCPAQSMIEKPLVDKCARLLEDSDTRFHPVNQLNWEDEIIWGSPTSSDHGSGSCLIYEHRDVYETGEMANSMRLDQNFSMRSAGNSHLVSCADSKDLLELMEDCGSTELPASKRMRISQENTEGKTVEGMKWITRMLSTQNRNLLDGAWLNQIVWDPTDYISNQKPVIPQFYGHSSLPESSTDSVNLSNDEFYSKPPQYLQTKIRPRRHSDYQTKVVHSILALKLLTMQPKLSTGKIANFHRPRSSWYPRENKYASKLEGDICVRGPIKMILKSLGGKYIKLKTDVGESSFFIKSKISKKFCFKSTEKVRIFYQGKELDDSKTLAHQGVKPNSLLHIMRSKIHLWLMKGLPHPPREFRSKSDLSLKDGQAIVIEYSDERPLFLGNIGMGARIIAYYRCPNHKYQTSLLPTNLFNAISLDTDDESPFLFRNIYPGCSQISLETNMYRAPLFPQQPSSTDYLLVRSGKGRLSLRRINKIYAAGPQEPLKEVSYMAMANIRSYNSKRLLVYVYRQFCAREHPWIRSDELSYQFPSISKALLRKTLKHCAELVKRRNGVCAWIKKPDFKVPSEGEIRRILSPEDVCSYESMQSGVYTLKCLGINQFRRPINISSVSHLIDLEVASYIERKLLMTPWNLSLRFLRNKNLEISDQCSVMRHPYLCHGGCHVTCNEDDSDLDSFAVDLENMLVAEDGGQREAEDEDDASEAALMSMLLHDDDNDADADADADAGDMSIHRRLIFACGACERRGHMKTNKSCPMYNNERETREAEDKSAGKLMRLETSEQGNKGSLKLKFKFSHNDLECKKVEEMGVRTVPSLVLRLPASRKITIKPPTKAQEADFAEQKRSK